jgi:hypothetical protein
MTAAAFVVCGARAAGGKRTFDDGLAFREPGQPIVANPLLTGTLLGVQNDDRIIPGYSTVANPASPVGSYEIVPGLYFEWLHDGRMIRSYFTSMSRDAVDAYTDAALFYQSTLQPQQPYGHHAQHDRQPSKSHPGLASPRWVIEACTILSFR